MKQKYTYIVIFMLFFAQTVRTQMTNTGELYVTSGTVFLLKSDFENTGHFTNNGETYVYANFKNDGGVVDFTSGESGYTLFQGTEAQEISGDNNFYNVLFDNNLVTQPAFKLLGTISIANKAEFNKGIVDNANFGGTIVFEQNATHTNATDNSFVDGFITKIGAVPFNKSPIGNKKYCREVSISAPKEALATIKMRYLLENSNSLYSHSLAQGAIAYIDTNEYWEIIQETGNSPVAVTLSWNEKTSSKTIVEAPSKKAIHIVRWDTDKGYWIDEGGIVDEKEKTVTTVSKGTGYGVFALALIKEESMLPPTHLIVYNGVTNNGDGVNDALKISFIEEYPENTLQIFNRWGVKVFEVDGYNNTDNAFKGFSDGRVTVAKNQRLPSGTYFYILTYKHNNEGGKKAGYLYLK